MSQKPRRDEILNILKRNGFCTVNALVNELHYSTATIYRDLNELEHLNLVKRSYGGVELAGRKGMMSLSSRYDYMKPEKRRLAQIAAACVEDGDTIFLAGGSTTEYMAPYLADKKNIHVITHNIRLVEYFAELGIEVTCLGGKMFDPPSILLSEETVENIMKFNTDKAFLSPTGISETGDVEVSEAYYMVYRVSMQRAKKTYLISDKSKWGRRSDRRISDLSGFDCVISDIAFPSTIKGDFPKTKFFFAGEEK
ncbi:MAG: DeoR/GlpR transcriptional regulator [Clostridia bacterium]|nr:DeoR/GlpR transcriptional regulator [Clostridia bacterium]